MKKRTRSWLAALMAAALMCAYLPVSALAAGDAVTVLDAEGAERAGYATLHEAVQNAEPGDTVALNETVTLSEPITIDKPLTLTGPGYAVNNGLAANKDMFKVTDGGALALKDVTIDGRSQNNNAYLVHVSGGALSIEKGAKLTGSGFSAVFVTNGSCTLDGGEISGNTYKANNSVGAAATINANGVFTMESGIIQNNSAPQSFNGSAGVMVNSGAKAYLNGGVITGNTAKASPAVTVEGTLEINGTDIQNNTASGWAGAMAVYARGAVVMNSGKITGNKALDGNAGAVYVEGYEGRPASFTLNGGSITNNTAAYDGGAILGYVDIQGDGDLGMSKIAINGGTIAGNKEQAADAPIEGAIFIRPGVQLDFSGSPRIEGINGIEAVDDTPEANPDFQPIEVSGPFAPAQPIVLELWMDYAVGQKIVQYTNGATADPAHFTAPANSFGYQKDEAANALYTEAKRKVLFKDGLYDEYESLSHWAFVESTVEDPAGRVPDKPGYTLAGWYTDSALTKPWDFEKDTLPREEGNFVLYAKWTALPAEAPELPAQQSVSLSCAEAEGAVLTPGFEEKSGYRYEYLWQNAAGETVGREKALTVPSPALGESAAYTVTVTAVREDNGQTAQAGCTVTISRAAHQAGQAYQANEEKHWTACAVCGEALTEGAHAFQWVVDKQATELEAGQKHEVCTVCGYEKAPIEIPALGQTTEAPAGPAGPAAPGQPTQTPAALSPQTGDSGQMGLWAALSLLGAMGMAFTLCLAKRRSAR